MSEEALQSLLIIITTSLTSLGRILDAVTEIAATLGDSETVAGLISICVMLDKVLAAFAGLVVVAVSSK